MDYNSLPNFYAALDAKYNVTNNELNSATYTNVDCNFVYSAKYARHRWFNYKEGFSPILVEKIFNEYKLNKSSVVCDPFCGAGTTVAVAKAKGMKSIGFEVNPFAAFITKVKTENYCFMVYPVLVKATLFNMNIVVMKTEWSALCFIRITRIPTL